MAEQDQGTEQQEEHAVTLEERVEVLEKLVLSFHDKLKDVRSKVHSALGISLPEG